MKIEGIQILRAVAVFLVTWLHAGQALGSWRVVELPHFVAFGIDIFFVISGFIMATISCRENHSWKFLKRRLIRIFPIYWIFAGLEYLRLAHSHRSLMLEYLPSLLLLPGLYPKYPLLLGVSWTLVFEMFFYYTLTAVLLFTSKPIPITMILLGIASFVPGPTVITSPILLEFVAGAAIALAFQRFGIQRRFGIVLLVIGSVIALYMQAHPQYAGVQGIDMVSSSRGVMQRVLTWGIAATLIVAGVVFWSPSTQNRPAKIAISLGDASYSTYLLSAIMIEFTTRTLIRLAQPSLAAEIVFQFLIVGLVLVAGSLSYRFIEKPMMRRPHVETIRSMAHT